jgi:uncharacterized membrane protein
MIPAIASALHILGLALAFAMIVLRDRAFSSRPFDPAARDRMLAADNVYGVASMMLVGAGLWRLFGELQKPTRWYMQEYTFHLKMTLVGIAMCLEIPLMVTFIKWRYQMKAGRDPDLRRVATFRTINRIELALMALIVVAAAVMARGLWHEQASSPGCRIEDTVVAKCLTCHGTTAPQGGMVLQDRFHEVLVGVHSTQWPDQIRVVPGDPEASLMYRKVAGTQAPHGLSMPMGLPLDPALAEEVKAWIEAGAPACR